MKMQGDPFEPVGVSPAQRAREPLSEEERRHYAKGGTIETRRDEDGREGKTWLLDGYPDREYGPAIERDDGSHEWWIHGRRHRENGPAVIAADGVKSWWKEGLPHREDGPALEHPSGRKLWALEGKVFGSEEEWRQALTGQSPFEYPVVEAERAFATFATFVLSLTGLAQNIDPRQRERLATKTRSTHRGAEGEPYWRFDAGSSARFDVETLDGRKVAGRLQAFCWGVAQADEEDYSDFVGREAEDSFLSALTFVTPRPFFADTRLYEPGELVTDEDGEWMRFEADLPCSVEVLTKDRELERGMVEAIAFRQA